MTVNEYVIGLCYEAGDTNISGDVDTPGQHSSGMTCIVNTKPLADVVRYLAFNHS